MNGAYEPVLDGSATIGHDAYDVDAWHDGLEMSPRMRKQMEADAAKSMATAPALYRDLFMAFNRRHAAVNPPAPLTSAYQPHRAIMEELLGTEEFKSLKGHGTAGDTFLSSVATVGAAQDIVASLPKDVRDQIDQARDLERQIKILEAQASVLEDAAERLREEYPERGRAEPRQREADERRLVAQMLQRQLDEEPVLGMTEPEMDHMRQVARAAFERAASEVQAAADALDAFGGSGWGSGGSRSGYAQGSAAERAALAQRVMNSQQLRLIAELAGRMTRIAMSKQKSKVDQQPSEVTDIKLGRDLGRLLPSELALLSDPDTEDMFIRKWLDGSLLSYELVAKEPQGRGPIILALDESGSMSAQQGPHQRIVWAKAVAMAILAIANKQKRDFVCYSFADGPLKAWEFPAKQPINPGTLLGMAEHHFGGGTDYDRWMQEALLKVNLARYDKADVILVSDGLCGVMENRLASWQMSRQERGMRAYAVLIGCEDYYGTITAMTDKTVSLADLGLDGEATDAVFSI